MQLFFKHLYPSFKEWQEPPFTPWEFGEGVLLTVLSFFESDLFLEEEINAFSDVVRCSVMMDSGAFMADGVGFVLDPMEVVEMHALLKADLIVPLDRIIFEEDSDEVVEQKIEETLANTKLLLDHHIPGSEVVGTLQGFSQEVLERLRDEYRSLGIRYFGIGGLVFQRDLRSTRERILVARELTKGHRLHVFGKFLHPRLMRIPLELGVDSVDGFGYLLSSVKGLYLKATRYTPIREITTADLERCACSACVEHDILDFQRGDEAAQYLLIRHNIHNLINLKHWYMSRISNE